MPYYNRIPSLSLSVDRTKELRDARLEDGSSWLGSPNAIDIGIRKKNAASRRKRSSALISRSGAAKAAAKSV